MLSPHSVFQAFPVHPLPSSLTNANLPKVQVLPTHPCPQQGGQPRPGWPPTGGRPCWSWAGVARASWGLGGKEVWEPVYSVDPHPYLICDQVEARAPPQVNPCILASEKDLLKADILSFWWHGAVTVRLAHFWNKQRFGQLAKLIPVCRLEQEEGSWSKKRRERTERNSK